MTRKSLKNALNRVNSTQTTRELHARQNTKSSNLPRPLWKPAAPGYSGVYAPSRVPNLKCHVVIFYSGRSCVSIASAASGYFSSCRMRNLLLIPSQIEVAIFSGKLSGRAERTRSAASDVT